MEDVKTLIRSILISSPLQLEIWKLDKDYEELNGEKIPYQQHGFKSLEHLLRNIPDIVRVCGTGPHAKLEVLITSKSAHIDKLISKQRVKAPPKKKFTHRRPRYPEQFSFHQQRTRPLSCYTPFAPMHAAFDFQHMPRQRQFPLPPARRVFDIGIEDKGRVPMTIEKSFPSTTPLHNSDTSKPNVESVAAQPADAKKSESTMSLGAIPKTKPFSHQYLFHESSESEVYLSDHEIYMSDNEDCVKPNDSRLEFPADDKNINENVPPSVQRNLKQLIAQFEEGVWCAEVPKIYMKMFNKPLDYLEYGYMSLSAMCKDLDYIFHSHRPGNGDFLLFDRSKPVPQNVLTKAESAAQSDFRFDQEANTYGQEPALLDVEIYPFKFIEFI